MLAILRIFIAISLCSLLTGNAAAQLYSFSNFNHRSGLNFGTINVIGQSEDGAVYLGTDGGELIRYDGQEFKELNIDPKLNTHHFSSIQNVGQKIYFTSTYKGFFEYDIEKNDLRVLDKNPSSSIPLLILHFKGNNFLIRSTGVSLEHHGKTKLIENFKDDIINDVYHYIVAPNFIFISTDRGNFIINDNAVISLKDLLNGAKIESNDLVFGYHDGDHIYLYNREFNHELRITFDANQKINGYKETYIDQTIPADEKVIDVSYNRTSKKIGVLTEVGSIYTLEDGILKKIIHNFPTPLVSVKSIFTDRMGDYWIGSDIKGLYKVSLEAFTRIQMHPVYMNPDISLTFRSDLNDVIVSTMSGKTYVANITMNTDFKEFEIRTYAFCEFQGKLLAGTNTGLKVLNNGPDPTFNDYLFDTKRINFLFKTKDNTQLWIHVIDDGLYIMEADDNPKKIVGFGKDFPSHFYTAQEAEDGNSILFGTNDGLVKYDRANDDFTRLNQNLGSFCANSTTDIFGTRWFTLDEGIVGFTVQNKKIELHGPKLFRSTLFYTLTSDAFGNLIIGTNKGIDLLKINKHGKITSHRVFDQSSGFKGFETHMRSSFENKGISYLGTVEGLFSVNTAVIEELKTPLAPYVNFVDYNNENAIETSAVHLKVGVYNSKFGVAKYQYRVVGLDDQWKIIDNPNSLILEGLSDGSYIIEVRASYDGITYGPIKKFKFSVDLPLWKSNWFIILILIGVILLNIFLIQQNKNFNATKLLNSNESLLNVYVAPAVLLFAAISISSSLFVAPFLDDSLQLHLASTLAISFILFCLYFFSLSAKKTGNRKLNQIYLIFALMAVTLNFYYEIYITHLHPFHVIGLVLTTTVVPYVLHRVKYAIIYSFMLLFLSSLCIILMGDTIYPKSYFLITNIVMICLIIINSYLRFDSIEKLTFVSGILNKGNFPAVAFDPNGIIIYASENIRNYIDATSEWLIKKKITTLNTFIPYEGKFKDSNILTEFKDGEKYIVPMRSADNKINWLEWTYNVFSENVRVITGNDVTEKIELENTYELLVQNAEDFIYRCDLEGNFLFLNDPCFEKLGYSKEELLYTNSMRLARKDYKMDLLRYYKRHFENNLKTSYKEFPIVKKDGSEVWVAQYMTTIYHPGSSIPSGYIALARDITERRISDEIIRLQSESITDSINYAQKIQQRLLPQQRKFKSNFNDFFIFYQPKDIVSGDFYWYENIGGKHYLILADCTGHGVPGAFMTLLGTNMLNTIILENGHRDPGMILTLLHKRLTALLPNGDQHGNDGMEMVICSFEDNTEELAFACAGARFFVYSENEITMLKGDANHIGDTPPDGFNGFRTHFSNFKANDQLILFTDGFHDQFGGPKDKRFFFRNFVELIEEHALLPMTEQKKILNRKFLEWKGEEEQTDDVTIISIKKLALINDKD